MAVTEWCEPLEAVYFRAFEFKNFCNFSKLPWCRVLKSDVETFSHNKPLEQTETSALTLTAEND